MNTRIEQLIQLFNGAVWDGNLISKKDRDELWKLGLIARTNGWNIITTTGVKYLVHLDLVHPE